MNQSACVLFIVQCLDFFLFLEEEKKKRKTPQCLTQVCKLCMDISVLMCLHYQCKYTQHTWKQPCIPTHTHHSRNMLLLLFLMGQRHKLSESKIQPVPAVCVVSKNTSTGSSASLCLATDCWYFLIIIIMEICKVPTLDSKH